MITTQLLPRQHQKSGTAPRVSLRTLILLVELLITVVAFQYLATARPAQANALWLAADCHTASSIQRRISDPVAPASAPAVAGEDLEEP